MLQPRQMQNAIISNMYYITYSTKLIGVEVCK